MEKITFYCTGGTIDKIYFDNKRRYEVGEPQVQEILEEAGVTFDYSIQSILNKDSLDMTDRDRDLIAETVEKDTSTAIVITHGTDTMVQTAQQLSRIQHKTIVLTGAMQPARFKSSDAVFNIGCAVLAVQLLKPGVYIVMNGRIFKHDNVRKNDVLNQFEELKSK